MSMHLEFEPHSWYMGAAIKDNRGLLVGMDGYTGHKWNAYFLNGMTGYIVDFEAESLTKLKQQIKEYRSR